MTLDVCPPWDEDEERERLASLVATKSATPPPSSWQPVDLTRFLDGTHTAAPAGLVRRSDGVKVAYAGRVHWISGEPESLKTWLALLPCVQTISGDQRAVFIDLEDGPAGIVSRLLAMGLTPEQISSRFTYLSPDGALSYGARAALEPLIAAAAVVVIDAATEALALQGLSSQDDTDIAAWLSLLPRWAAKLGPAVFVLDHVTKNAETRGRWATGSQHKLSGLDGVAYLMETTQAGGVGMTGRSRVYIAKDRHGQVRPHSVPSAGGRAWLGDLVVDATGPFVDVALHPPAVREPHDSFRPTVVMAKISDALQKADKPLSGRDVEARVTGKATVIRSALAALEDEGHIVVENGPRGSRLHRLVTPFSDQETST